MDLLDVLEVENRWAQALAFVAVWVVVFLGLGVVMDKDPMGQVVQGVVSGVAFGAVYTYLRERED